MEYISYAASFIATVLSLIEPFNKKMKTVLIFSLIGNALIATSYLIVGGFSGAAICFTAAVQLIINFFYASKSRPLPKIWLALHLAAFTAVNLLTFRAWYDSLSLVAAMLFVLSVSQSNAKYYRAIYIPNLIIWIVYDIFAFAYGNLVTHAVVLAALLVAVAVRDRKVMKNDEQY